ncbi:MAG TPA: hypothetical protein VK138_07375 [Acidiferrobacterales bacterium]|nr:hypothetical protein [Acidiferrobacterales bacterium]
MENLEAKQTKALEDASAFIKSHVVSSFKPVAYYDERLDCVRVITRDCSVTEFRINEYLTIAEDTHSANLSDRYVGFTVKGIRHFMRALNKEPKSLELTVLLDQVLAELPAYMPDVSARKLVEFAVNIALWILDKSKIKKVEVKLAA